MTLNKANYFSGENSYSRIPVQGLSTLLPSVLHWNTPRHNFRLFTANLRLFSTHVNRPAAKTAVCRSEMLSPHPPPLSFLLPRRKQWVSLPPGHGGFGAITNNRQCDRDKGNALVSHVVRFWESTPEFTQEKLHFCFDLIKAKYWAIVRHLAGYAWHCNYLLRCFCLKGCIHAWNQFLHWLVKGCAFFLFLKKIRHCLLIVPLSCL